MLHERTRHFFTTYEGHVVIKELYWRTSLTVDLSDRDQLFTCCLGKFDADLHAQADFLLCIPNKKVSLIQK